MFLRFVLKIYPPFTIILSHDILNSNKEMDWPNIFVSFFKHVLKAYVRDFQHFLFCFNRCIHNCTKISYCYGYVACFKYFHYWYIEYKLNMKRKYTIFWFMDCKFLHLFSLFFSMNCYDFSCIIFVLENVKINKL